MDNLYRKKHIVLLTDCLKDLQGGAERQIYELAQRMDKSKYHVTIVSLECEGQAPREKIEAAGCQLKTFPVKRIYGLSGLREGFRFIRFLKKDKTKILVTYHFSSDIWGTLMAKMAGVKIVISNRRDLGFWRGKKHILAYKMINPFVEKIVTVSQAVKDMVITQESAPRSKVVVIYNGVELKPKEADSQRISREELGIGQEDTVVMHVANLRPVKGHRYLLEAFASALSRFPNTKLVLLGEGELQESLKEQAKRLNISGDVLFLGKKQNARQYLSIADICVLPSLSEGMPNAVLEYMAAGKPVVATKVGGTSELLENGITGLLVKPENVNELGDALKEFLKDPASRKSVGQEGLKKVKEQFSIEHMVSCYDELFAHYLGFHKSRVLHLVSSIGLFGAERVILTLAQNNKKVSSIVGALNNKHNPHLEIIDDAREAGLETAVFDSWGQFDPFVILKLRKFLKENRIDILHTHNYKSDIVGFLATRGLDVLWVATNHGWTGAGQTLSTYESLDAFVLRFADKVFAVSHPMKEKLESMKIKVQNLCLVDNCIDLTKFDLDFDRVKYRRSLGINNGEAVVLIAGRLSEEKGHVVLLQAVRKVLQNTNMKLLVVGDGPLKDHLQAKAVQLGLSDQVIFAGVRKDMPQVYAVSDLMVNASFTEGLPMTILEAMASKLCIIATTVGAVPDVIEDDKNGFLIKPGDTAGLAEKICFVIKNPQKKEKLAKNAYKTAAERFNAHNMIEQYEENYQAILSN